jgi:predicted transposase YbfD/YdcC
MAHLAEVPDYRHPRGKSLPWVPLLELLCLGLLSGQKTIYAIADWAKQQTEDILRGVPTLPRIPSFSTLYRVARFVALTELEQKIADYGAVMDQHTPEAGQVLLQNGESVRGLALDGKELRGASVHGEPVALLSLVRHGSSMVLGEARVQTKTNEIPVARELLAERDLRQMVITMDALHTQRATAQQIVAQGGHYLMVVKANQRELYQAIDLLFQIPPLRGEDDRRALTTTEKDHGRIETRTLTTTSDLGHYLNWPAASQVARREYRSVEGKTQKVRHEITYGITSLSGALAGPEQLETLWRGHWTIENRLHYVRDETLGEDRCQMHAGHAAQALAALRNGLLNMLRAKGWQNIAAALRHFGASVQDALVAIGATET